MKNIHHRFVTAVPLLLALMMFSGCSGIGAKALSLSVVYGATTVLALLLLIIYCSLVTVRESWFLLLFSSVFVVNGGYLTLSLSTSLSEALLANRIAYLGSVFLPLAMLMIISNACNMKPSRLAVGALSVFSFFTFLIAASPGYSDIYYKSVSVAEINGITVLEKVYGPWHKLYLFYLLSYFSLMVAVIIRASLKKKLRSYIHSVTLASAVLVNIAVWLLEQLVHFDFEFLSVSYIISEVFLLGIHLLNQENLENRTIVSVVPSVPEASVSPVAPVVSVQEAEKMPETPVPEKKTEEILPVNEGDLSEEANDVPAPELSPSPLDFSTNVRLHLTPTERAIYDLYVAGQKPKDVMLSLNIKENTLKYHNRNIYNKLGVSSRKQLIELALSAEHTNQS